MWNTSLNPAHDHHDDYFERLRRRKRAGLWYRDLWLYPRICGHLSGTVLDVGCGIGDMVRHRPLTVGVDVNPKAVSFCQRQGLRVQLMQPDRLPFADGEFDGAVLDNVLEHLERPEPLLAEVHRVLRAAGTFVAGVPGECGFESDSDHKRHYSEDALIHALRSAGFQPSRIFHQPFRSRILDRHFLYYAIYGVFQRI